MPGWSLAAEAAGEFCLAGAGPLTAQELAAGMAFADALLVLVLNERGGIPTDGMTAATVSERRAQVHQATGMVAA